MSLILNHNFRGLRHRQGSIPARNKYRSQVHSTGGVGGPPAPPKPPTKDNGEETLLATPCLTGKHAQLSKARKHLIPRSFHVVAVLNVIVFR